MSAEQAGPGARADLAGLEALIEGSQGAVRVLRYPHETEPEEDGSTTEWACDVLVADAVPAPGFTTYATVGARRFATNLATDDGRAIRSELVAVSRTGWRVMADVLDACALAIASGTFHVAPGSVIPNAVAVIEAGHACEHMLLVAPFLWPDLQVVEDKGRQGRPGGEDGEEDGGEDYVLTRLQAVPITTAEARYAAEHGHEALFDLLDAARADVTDPDRPSVA